MPKKKYLGTLTDDEREHLEDLLHRGTHATRKVTRARILILGVLPEQQTRALGVMLYEELTDRLMAKGMLGAEASWILATNKPMNTAIEGVGAERYKTWRLYRREL